jgi:hypothetical protein
MVFQPISCTAAGVATGTGKLLPHLFTLIRQLADGNFLLQCYTLSDIFLLGRMVLCAVRTFLPVFHKVSEKRDDGTVSFYAKVLKT